MKRFEVGVDVTRAYVVVVEAANAQEAGNKVEALTPDEIDACGAYIDTHIIADDESEEVS